MSSGVKQQIIKVSISNAEDVGDDTVASTTLHEGVKNALQFRGLRTVLLEVSTNIIFVVPQYPKMHKG
jgi:hypothetical protein